MSRRLLSFRFCARFIRFPRDIFAPSVRRPLGFFLQRWRFIYFFMRRYCRMKNSHNKSSIKFNFCARPSENEHQIRETKQHRHAISFYITVYETNDIYYRRQFKSDARRRKKQAFCWCCRISIKLNIIMFFSYCTWQYVFSPVERDLWCGDVKIIFVIITSEFSIYLDNTNASFQRKLLSAHKMSFVV